MSVRKEIAVTGIHNKPNADGNHFVELTMPDGSVTSAIFSLEIARALVAVLNPIVHEDAVQTAQRMSLPTAEVSGVSIVHSGPTAELLIDTIGIGRLVLLMSDEWLQEVRTFLDRVQASRKASKTVQ
jgi:hypothetical protein